ncbi:cellulose biosynthesis cyclic di-GMP-binding regulatory protein BcsB [Oceaniglobus trochenteri]|uniref:cellulose biosynthesis cyclic di-GMP-binding regulatory protein BcsB n=1 Tax=Oceaniglobus trochenteri TaxID=2763260 RepID=UPI0024787076|nr:cellulose biosynthesis cyclic di-GMP-binding regulatory protein BcsB [Oceaniglobus trochenteri]
MPRFAFALLALMLGAGLALPGQAQQGQTPPEDVPVIDLGPILDEPIPAPAAPEAPVPEAPAPDIPVALPETPGVTGAEPVPEDELTLPQYDRGATGSPAGAPAPGAGAPPVAPPAPVATLLLPLRADRPTMDGITRLSGEVQEAGFFVDLPEGSIARDLVISYRIAINVLPEQSELRITVNGIPLDPVRPTAFEGFEPITLPGTLLQGGRNRIEIAVRHAHRIFCGPDATFAVWTEIDTNTSGAAMTAGDLATDPVDLALALRAQLAMEGSLPVRLENPADAELLNGFPARLAALRDGAPVILRPEPVYGVQEAGPQHARITVLRSGAPLAEVRRGADGALVLVLSTGADGQLPDFTGLLPLPTPVRGNALLTPGTTTPLAGLIQDELLTFNRYAELPVEFRLPDDWLVLASQKALLRLAYDFADGLPEGALMLVKVNDTTVRLLPLDRGANEARPLLDVGFPARLLHPGVNALTFVAIVPGDPPDLPCPPIVAPLLRIDSASTLEVAPSPRMAVPGMAAVLRALRPDQIVPASFEAPTAPIVPDTLAVLGSTLRPIAETTRLEGASLTVADLSAPGIPLGGLGISRRDLDRVLSPPAEAETGADTATPPAADADTPGEDAPGALLGLLEDVADRLRQLALPGDPPLADWLAARRGEAVVLLPDAEAAQDLWLVLGAGADPQRTSILLAQARLSAHGPVGRVALLTSEGTWESWHDRNDPPRLFEGLTLANFRDVAGNYASWSPLYFGLALFGLTLLSVALALIFVVTTRGRRKR